jgi:hypothetical protein
MIFDPLITQTITGQCESIRLENIYAEGNGIAVVFMTESDDHPGFVL